MPFNLGGIGVALGGAMPQINAALEQQKKRQMMQQLMMAYAGQQQQPQAPGGIQPAPVSPTGGAQPLPWQQPQGGMNSPQGGPVPLLPQQPQTPQQSPVAGIPGSQPVGGDSRDAIAQYLQQMQQDPLGLGAMAKRFQAAGIPPSQWGDMMDAYGSLSKDSSGGSNEMLKIMQLQNLMGHQGKTEGQGDERIAQGEEKIGIDKQRLAQLINGGGLTPDAINMLAGFVKNTGQLPTGLGWGMNPVKTKVINQAAGMPDSTSPDQPAPPPGTTPSPPNLAQAKLDYAGNTSQARATGTATGKIKLAANFLDQSIPLARDAMKGVDLTNFPDVNSVQNYARTHTGDPNISRLNIALQTTISDYAALISRTGTSTNETRETATKLVNSAMAKGQLNAVFDQMKRERDSILKGADVTKKSITTGGGEETETPAAPVNLIDKYGLEP